MEEEAEKPANKKKQNVKPYFSFCSYFDKSVLSSAYFTQLTSTLLKLISSTSAIRLSVLSMLSGRRIDSFTLLSLYFSISNILLPPRHNCRTKKKTKIPYKKKDKSIAQ